jgi:XrtJ-associated TM-motif-TM protein
MVLYLQCMYLAGRTEKVMKKQIVIVLVLLVMLPVMAHAQTGCIDSPECPTALLGLVGCLGAAVSWRRGRKG